MAAAIPWVLIGVGAVSSFAQARSQATDTRAIARYNAQVAEREAGIKRQQGQVRERAIRTEAEQVLGQQVAGYGRAGVLPVGTPLEVMINSAKQAELKAREARYSGEVGAYSSELEAGQQRFIAKRQSTLQVPLVKGITAFGQMFLRNRYLLRNQGLLS